MVISAAMAEMKLPRRRAAVLHGSAAAFDVMEEAGDQTLIETQEVDLAREPEFILGHLTVVPLTRELWHENGQREVIEYRVMQVLIALAQARGHVVTRDDLLRRCWSGRVVGEDAINRVISRLRKAAGGIGKDSFNIETITKIGYRLERRGEVAEDEGFAMPRGFEARRRSGPDRRTILLGAMAGAVAAMGGGGWLYARLGHHNPPAEVEAIMTQAWQSWSQGSNEGLSQAIGLYRRATELAPNHADAWGLLGCAYAAGAHVWARIEAEAMRDRSRAAARQALSLDPRNAYGRCALAYARPMMGNWLTMEREFRRARAEQPDRQLVIHGLAASLLRVGRCAEAADEFAHLQVKPDPPVHYYLRIMAEWGADRIERAERLVEESLALYPAQLTLWFASLKLAMFGGRPGKAVALLQDAQSHPDVLDRGTTDRMLATSQALRDRTPALVESLIAALPGHARSGVYAGEDAILAAAALGRVDMAFILLDAFYFSRPFLVPDPPPSPDRPPEARLDERATYFLFLPVMRPVRADPRFGRLAEMLGLERYWREAGAQPDFRKV